MLGLSLTGPAFAQPEVESNSLDATGCMKLGECTDNVTKIISFAQLREIYGPDWNVPVDVEQELTALIDQLNAVGIDVNLADQRYFNTQVRGLYFTDVNKVFLNDFFVADPTTMLAVLRHEGWHAAQDCMAGTLDNSLIAIIYDDMLIPQKYKVLADLRYGLMQPGAVPWEQEAIWAGSEGFMTADALEACSSGAMWETYEPTPMTKEWLTKEGYMSE